jgi:hypothetical protein
MIIDAHTHLEPLADYEGQTHAYGIAPVGLQTLLRQLDENGVDACFLFMCMGLNLESRIGESNDGLGPEKLLFGSDGSLGHRAITTAYLRRIARLDAPQEHKERILGSNARKLIKR